MDAERWQRLSPQLDALFELDADARAQRLAQLRHEDPQLAAELEELIELESGSEDFLAEPLVKPMAGARAGVLVGPYRLERPLGEGGMGQVWLAARADGLYQRRVALKLLRPGLVDNNLRLRFSRERQILARLAHPHIARLLDAGVSAEGLPYLALEYVDGEPITDYCRVHRTSLESRLRMFQQICDAVSHAHANLIVHRDLKPSNILVTPAGDVRLLDFGIAKLLDGETPMLEQTRTGLRAFTLHYAAPEQIRGEPVTTMTDVYSLGVVLYELLTDTKPYRLKRQTDAEWEEAILAVDPLKPSQTVQRATEAAAAKPYDPDDTVDLGALKRHARMLAGDLDNIVLKALSKRPEQRYPSVEALALDLQRYEAGRPVQARAQSLSYRFTKYLSRHRWAIATAGLVAFVLTASLGIVAWQARQALAEASRAQAMQDFMIGVFENAGDASPGQGLDLRGLLDASMTRGNRELARQPRARAELFGVIARIRTTLGDYREAQILLERQARIIDSTDDIPPSLRLESLTQRGEVLQLLGESRQCIDLMQPALAEARREQAQLPPQATEFYSQLGRCRRANSERGSARLLFEQSLALRRESARAELGEVENLIDLAGLDQDLGNVKEALAGFERAKARLRSVTSDRHPLLISIASSLGALHRLQGRSAAAERELREALGIALDVHGAQHPATLNVRRQLAAILIDQGRFVAAEQELEEVHRLQIARLGARNPQLRESYASLGTIRWERGEQRASLAALRYALTLSRTEGDAGHIADALMALGEVLHDSGRHKEAQPLLLEARQLRVQQFGADHPLVGDSERALGTVNVTLGKRNEGLAQLQLAVQLTRIGYGRTHPRTRLAELALARAQAGTGDARLRETALTQLDTLAALPETDIELRKIAWRARAYAAQLRCDGEQHEAAQLALTTLGERLLQTQPDGGTIPREVEKIAAACAVAPPDS